MTRHHRRELLFYLCWFGSIGLGWSLMIAAGFGLTALAAHVLGR
jgi:hypothetical protein